MAGSAFVRKIPPLFPDQKKSIDFELNVGSVVDTSEPGTGKTRVRLEVFAKRRVAGGGAALVLAPRSLLRTAWESDAAQYVGWLKTSVAFAINRKEAFDAKADMYITNHDATKWLAAQPPAFFKKFDTLIIDESDAYKHHTSQRSKALNKIKKYFKYRTIMNGVPTSNGVLDLWNQVNIVDDGKRLGQSFYAFRSAVCTPEQRGRGPNMVKWVDRDGIEPQVAQLISDISIRNTREGTPNHKYNIPFYMAKAHMAAYQQMEQEAILMLRTGKVTAVNAAVLSTKLLQIASGAVYDENDEYHVISPDRYELVADLMEARKHSLMFFFWKHQRDLMIEELKKRKLTYMVIDGDVSDKKRDENVKMFQAGMFRAALLHPKSAAHGLTLTKGTTTIWPSPTPNLAWYLQGNKRIDRIGQTEDTETIHVVAQDSYEEKVMAVLGQRGVKLIDLLRSIEQK